MKPGDEHVHNGLIWQVERVQLRGVDEKWARLVIEEGLGKSSRLVNVTWIRFDSDCDVCDSDDVMPNQP
jgi:hypothetical protein